MKVKYMISKVIIIFDYTKIKIDKWKKLLNC